MDRGEDVVDKHDALPFRVHEEDAGVEVGRGQQRQGTPKLRSAVDVRMQRPERGCAPQKDLLEVVHEPFVKSADLVLRSVVAEQHR